MSHDAQDDTRGKFPSLGPCSTPGRGLAGDSLGDEVEVGVHGGEVESSELAAVQLNGGSVTSTSGILGCVVVAQAYLTQSGRLLLRLGAWCPTTLRRSA